LEGKPLGKLSLGKLRRRWENNIQIFQRMVVEMEGKWNWLRIMSNSGFWYLKFWISGFCYEMFVTTSSAYLEARNKMRDLITSWIGILGPGCGPVHVVLSSGVMMTGGAATATTFPSTAQK
jgi:hypothetical protein